MNHSDPPKNCENNASIISLLSDKTLQHFQVGGMPADAHGTITKPRIQHELCSAIQLLIDTYLKDIHMCINNMLTRD